MAKLMKVRITLEEEMLGMSPSDPNIYEEYITKQAPDAASITEEIGAIGVEEVIDKCKTIFPRDGDGCPIMWDYQMKGFFKDACSMIQRIGKGKDAVTGKTKKGATASGQLVAHKKIIDGLIFAKPRRIRIELPEGGVIGDCQRPLRAQTAQGERIALANSETVPAGSIMNFEILILEDQHEAAIREWLRYGSLRGLGQWRNSGKGVFSHEILEVVENVEPF